MENLGESTRCVGVHKPNLADMAQHLEPDEKEKVAEKTSGQFSARVTPKEYLAITNDYEPENSSLIQKIAGGLLTNFDPIRRRRETAKQYIEQKSNPENVRMSHDLELSEEEILETLEKYEKTDEDPYELGLDDYSVLSSIKRKVWSPHHDSEEWQDKLSFKEFPGLGTFEYFESGACRTVYKGPVDGDDDKVIYIPDELSTPDAYADDFGNRMAQVAAAVQNKQNIEQSDLEAEFVSEIFDPVIVDLHGEPVPVVVADYREMEDIPDSKKQKGYEVAEELQKRSNRGNLIYHKTGTKIANAEFIKGGMLREDNLRHDPNTGELVVADAGEFNKRLSRNDVEGLLTEDMKEVVNNQRQRVR